MSSGGALYSTRKFGIIYNTAFVMRRGAICARRDIGRNDMIIPGILFLFGLLCLIKGGDWFVDGASALARRCLLYTSTPTV